MSASRLSSSAAVAAAVAAAASVSTFHNKAYADGSWFNPFKSSSSSPTPKQQPEQPPDVNSEVKQPEPDDPKGAGFDPDALERGAKALREINSSLLAKQVFDLMRRQEQTRLEELAAEKVSYEAIQAQKDIDRQRKLAEEQLNLVQQQAQAKAQMMRYEDELARKRMQTDHETQRKHNVELVRMQEESSIRKERARQATEEQIQAQQRQTEKERAEIERETIRAKLTEDHNRRMLVEKINGEREKWLAAINTAFSHIEGGFRTLLDDRRIYTTRFGLDYAMMTGGDVAPLGAEAVTKIHQLFDWAKKSQKGLLLFIDEADAFLSDALLFRTGDQSRDIVLVLATNRPGDLDSAVADRIDDERFKLLNLYLKKYLSNEGGNGEEPKWSGFFKKKPQQITVKDVTEEVLREAAKKTEGFSGREIAKLLREVVDYKVKEHHQRIKLASEGGQPQPS
ncbi:unnamed protein product [Linum tenue]|uniref:Uncharacterized protein n=1 Tax=Linum tenue TaxID=586396 RepID=A0AAV0I3M1_9ROSI|nr:unnamed protein product [Linum tenue]